MIIFVQIRIAMRYSVIVPVFNRPDEVDELLASLSCQSFRDFEVLVIEDGSSVPCGAVVEKYRDKIDVRYFTKPNSGPGQTRNFGAERAQGEWLIILDSDVVVPGGYFEAVGQELAAAPCDAFGGPDRAHESFSPVQKAINYAMTSFFTTGGIRGGKRKLDKFYPRSFNMGIRREAFTALGGFSKMRFGEDIDLSIRIFKAGYACRLFPEAWVWHKRRTDLRKFFRQVHNSGIARINLYKKYPDSLKIVHLLPALFTVGIALCLLLLAAALIRISLAGADTGAVRRDVLLFGGFGILPPLLFSALIFCDSALRNRSLKVGLLAVPAAFVQLLGYGSGFLRAWWQRIIRGKGEMQAFQKTFYK